MSILACKMHENKVTIISHTIKLLELSLLIVYTSGLLYYLVTDGRLQSSAVLYWRVKIYAVDYRSTHKYKRLPRQQLPTPTITRTEIPQQQQPVEPPSLGEKAGDSGLNIILFPTLIMYRVEGDRQILVSLQHLC